MPGNTAKTGTMPDLEIAKRLDLALQGAELGVWDWNVTTGAVAFDQRWAAMIGYELDEIEPHVSSWEKLVHPDDMAEVMRALTDHLEGRTPLYRTEHRMRHKDGHYIWILDSGKVFERDKDGKPLRAAGVHLDVTARRQAELDRENLIEKLNKTNLELDQYAHVIAHDLQQPLAAVIGFMESAQISLEKNDTAGLARSLSFARQASLDMTFSIEYLLEYASSTRTVAAHERVDLGAVAAHVLNLLPYMYPETADTAIVQISPALPTLRCDKIQIHRVFSNLMGNAFKYADESRPLQLEIGGWQDDRRWVIFVRDNGVGMPADASAGLFEIAMRRDVKPGTKGHGFGLAICRKIIRDHGGDIWMESESGKGSTVYFTLPA